MCVLSEWLCVCVCGGAGRQSALRGGSLLPPLVGFPGSLRSSGLLNKCFTC